MSKISVVGYPRFGKKRELKKATEGFFKGSIPENELYAVAKQIQEEQWRLQKEKHVSYVPCNDFSLYDTMLDTAVMLQVIPENYRRPDLGNLGTYFALARGCQNEQVDLKAWEMKKWFTTNYHYVVPEIDDTIDFKLNSRKILDAYERASAMGITAKPVIIGPFTFLKLAKIKTESKRYHDYIQLALEPYLDLVEELQQKNVAWLQIDEPALVTDLDQDDIRSFVALYEQLLLKKGNMKILLQTYFGDIRDIYQSVIGLAFDGIGLDFIEGAYNLDLIKNHGFPEATHLFAGIVNGKNIWKNNYRKSLEILTEVAATIPREDMVLSTSCSLLHVPYTVALETELPASIVAQLAFAEEKLTELSELGYLWETKSYESEELYQKNQSVIDSKQQLKDYYSEEVRSAVAALTRDDFRRSPVYAERKGLQRNSFNLPPLPVTTIGSFPQTADVRIKRRDFKSNQISSEEYTDFLKKKIKEVIRLQEEIDLDVLVHGEYERNDMVEYFGENLDGFVFTQNGWVQSYGTRGVKPPIIFGDVKRRSPIAREWITYAQSLTEKPVKGMLTGPITILNWSFPREDLGLKDIALQIGLAIREEVLDLEASGIQVIQIDEAALREKLPLRKANWHKEYLDWAIDAFRLVHSRVKPTTQIHTHMCYSEFSDIIEEIKLLDADVITIEAAKSDLSILDVLNTHHYDKQVGPGVYDIHSPRVPDRHELVTHIKAMLAKIDKEQLWINPDCGLKTRGMEETVKSLKNMVAAAKEMRETFHATK